MLASAVPWNESCIASLRSAARAATKRSYRGVPCIHTRRHFCYREDRGVNSGTHRQGVLVADNLRLIRATAAGLDERRCAKRVQRLPQLGQGVSH
eukprot:980435-Prymnesium_polylepis.1